jgi:hypothetical protein
MRTPIRTKHSPGLILAAILVPVIVLALGAVTTAFAQAVLGGAGQQVAIDPQTGELRHPTPEEAKALSQALQPLAAQPTQELTVTYHPDGSISMELPEEYMAVLVAKINPDGTVSMECVTGPKAAAAWLATDTPTTDSEAPSPSASLPLQ